MERVGSGGRLGRRTVLAAAVAAPWVVAACGAPRAVEPDRDRAHTDVVFIGAHPDDEMNCLAAFGQWRAERGTTTSVITVTRGEGGGNAAGLEEGPELGLIREAEERTAAGHAGIENIYYLDKPDFWYTLSAPLTARIWDERDTLARLVRLIRRITPHTVVVMDPRPFDQHGGHQLSARLGIEAFRLAGDRTAFPEQLTGGLAPWQPSGLLAQIYEFGELLGPQAPTLARTDSASGLPVFGVWSGTYAPGHATTWAQVERDAQRRYVTQGFAALPERVPSDPQQLGSAWFTVLAEDGQFVTAPVHRQTELKPRYAEFRDWADRMGLPWLANRIQPGYPPNPVTTVPAVSVAPALDGIEGPGEYPGPELPLAVWAGGDTGCAATAKVSRCGDDLYVLVRVTDDRPGAALAADDIKRHWRTDAVEIVIDPRGDSDDTSTTFKLGVLPYTAHRGGPAAERDADQHQGPAVRTAPGVRVAAVITDPYRGYAVEVKIPLTDLPAPVDPARFAMNILVYDSDTEDRTGRTRLAWSPFGSPQADPYVWGTAELADYAPPNTGAPPRPAVIPQSATHSADSPASRNQAARTGIPLAGAH